MGVNLYIELKKKELGFVNYPLCISSFDIKRCEIKSFDSTSGAIVCAESNANESHIFGLEESGNIANCYIAELELMNYIDDTNGAEVKENQFYKDKATLVDAWRSKEHALEMLRGKPADGYRQLPIYIHILKTVYPNSYISMHKSSTDEFMYLFIALRPLMRGFQFCRPVVIVDGAHLDGPYKGTFVSASTLDGADITFLYCCILPLAYGIVDTENDASWMWIFQNFKNAFGERDNMCVVSDRNESIIKSVSMVFPNVPHFACIWHIWKNVCTKYRRSKAVLSDIFYSMAKAYRKDEVDKLMAKVERIDQRVAQYLKNAGYEKWSRVHATVNRGRMMTSNIAECINGCLVEARELPIIDFLEQTRMLFGSWTCKNREIASYTKHTLGRKFEDILVSNTIKCSRMKVHDTYFLIHIY
ncbi:uncharacterized protein LOC129899916 [Solanum dulcamara]|uniref:uncharacterized protein LOC129899916 n=1 Tax=Solanum dulcamara TaxID=45834 RepID=UPI002485412A|nr:uncharacterized protein LOC129899916 [Solanum dulcamara]